MGWLPDLSNGVLKPVLDIIPRRKFIFIYLFIYVFVIIYVIPVWRLSASVQLCANSSGGET